MSEFLHEVAPAGRGRWLLGFAAWQSKCWGAGHGGHDPCDASDVHVLHQPPPYRACTLRPVSHSIQARASAQDNFDLDRMLASLGGLDRQEFVALALALAILGFSVVAAILLMRTRTRAAENELQPARRNPGAAGRERSQQRAAAERAAGRRVLARRRRPPAGCRRHVAAAGRRAAAARAGVRNLARARTVAAARTRRRSAAQRRRELRVEPRDLDRSRRSRRWAGSSAARRSCAFAS